MADFPAGMSLITVVGHLSSPTGRYKSGYIRVFAERKVAYTGAAGWLMDEVSPPIPTKLGDFSVQLPHSDQTGLLGDNGAPLTLPLGYKIVLYPTQSKPIETLAWQTLPMSMGATVPLSQLTNLGGWPNATIVVGGGGGGTGTTTYVPVTVSGNTGYWSPA